MASTIKVNNIQNQCGANIVTKCGSTITLGASGDTVQLAPGTSNAIGGVDWDTTAKTANFTAEAGKGYFVDTTSSEVTVTLPTGVAGESVTILDYIANANTNPILLSPQSGEKIEGGTDGQIVTTNRQATTLTYSGATQGWLVSSSGDSGPIILPTITFNTASGSLGTLDDTQRSDPNGNLSPVTATTTFGTLNYSIQSGSLPSGLTINSSTGAFVGTADSVASNTVSNFTVRATITETGLTSDRSFSITINAAPAYVTASGGTQTTCGDFKIHTFTGPGTFTVSCAGNEYGSNLVDYLIVAGGGGGGGNSAGNAGGGGGGGYRPFTCSPVTATGYPVTVGGGGGIQSQGGSSSIFGNSSTGGGRGGNYASPNPGGPGGSGGGGAQTGSPGGSGNAGGYSPPEGFNGQASAGVNGGGGGGAGGTGTGGSGSPGGAGGNGGVGSNAWPGDSTYRAGGGGGSGHSGGSGGSGGTGGGGKGAAGSVAGSANTGGGGGGGGEGDSGSGGGSGIVIIKYRFQN